jgi:protein O-GlcNAc transferase
MSAAEALAQHRAGDRAAAEKLYRRALVTGPNDPEVIHGYGVLCHETGRPSEALTLLLRAVQLAPGVAQYTANLGGVLSKFGRYSEAISCLQRALKTDPQHPDAMRNLALALMEAGRPAEARAPLLGLLRQSPERGDLWRLLGRAERLKGEHLAAACAFRRASELVASDHRCWDGLGLALDQLGDGLGAVAAFQRALTLRPDDAETLCHLGIALRKQHRCAEALAVAGRAIAREPNRAEAHHLLGTIHQEMGAMALAAPAYLRAIELVPTAAESHSNLGTVQVRLGRTEQAIGAFRRVLELSPGQESATAGLYAALRTICDWQAADAIGPELDRLTKAALAQHRRPSESPLAQLSRPCDEPTRLALAAAWSGDLARRARPPLPRIVTSRPRDGRIRLAYLSSDFRDHAVAQLSAAVFGLHERGRFEVTAYAANPEDPSVQRRRIAAGCERFIDVQALDNRQLAERIAQDGIDILVDLNGMTSGNRLAAMALRPAPIQATWLGFPGTSGASFIDYLIADPIVAPQAHQRFFSERICRLPHCYLPHDPDEPVAPGTITREQAGLPLQGLVFCSFNAPQKIDRETFAVWMRLLREVPGSLLWLHGVEMATQENLSAAAQTAQVDRQRLVFADRPSKPEHLRRLAIADIALDTRSYNGHTTSLDALFAGVPLVAELGEAFASRVAASALHSLGLPGLIARNAERYFEIALRLAQEPASRQSIRATLAAARNTAPLFDAPRFVRNLERGYEAMMACLARGEAPAPIDVKES